MGDRASSSAAVGRRDSSETESFRFQIALAIPESQLFAWFEQAQPGERVVYCRGYVPLRDDAAFKLAGSWGREGLVHLLTERVGSQTEWIAVKRGKAAPAPAAKPVGPAATAARIAELQLDTLLALLRAAAAKGARCPTKTVLAREVTGQTDQRARNRVTYLRKRLVAEGKIAVAAGTHARAPVVTILAKGRGFQKSTKGDG